MGGRADVGRRHQRMPCSGCGVACPSRAPARRGHQSVARRLIPRCVLRRSAKNFSSASSPLLLHASHDAPIRCICAIGRGARCHSCPVGRLPCLPKSHEGRARLRATSISLATARPAIPSSPDPVASSASTGGSCTTLRDLASETKAAMSRPAFPAHNLGPSWSPTTTL